MIESRDGTAMTAGVVLLAALQQTILTGVVRDSIDLEPIGFARVTVTATQGEQTAASGTSDRFGAFVVPGAPGGQPVLVEVAAFGYAPWTRSYAEVPTEPIRVLLRPCAGRARRHRSERHRPGR